MSAGDSMGIMGQITGGINANIQAESEAGIIEAVAEQKYDWNMAEIGSQRKQVGLQQEEVAESVNKVRAQGSREGSGLLAVSGARGVSKHGASFKVLKEDIKERYASGIRTLDRQRQALHESEKVLDIREGQADLDFELSKLDAWKTRMGGKAALHSGIMGAIGGVMESVTGAITGIAKSGIGSPSSPSGAQVPQSPGTGYGGTSLMPTTQSGAFGGGTGGNMYRNNFIAF